MNIPFNELISFLIHHWQLSLAFIAVLGVWIGLEFRYTFNGIPQLTPSQAIFVINREEPVILDVRDISSFTKSHLQGALNIPFVDLNQGNGKLEQHKERKILLVCAQGLQSAQAAQILHKQGYTHVVILKGGLQAWLAEGLPVVKGNK